MTRKWRHNKTPASSMLTDRAKRRSSWTLAYIQNKAPPNRIMKLNAKRQRETPHVHLATGTHLVRQLRQTKHSMAWSPSRSSICCIDIQSSSALLGLLWRKVSEIFGKITARCKDATNATRPLNAIWAGLKMRALVVARRRGELVAEWKRAPSK